MKDKQLLIQTGNVDEAVEVMKEAAKWLIDIGKPMWKLDDITNEKLLKTNKEDEFYVLKVDNEAAGAMILKWYDPFFWSDIKQNESGFVHKLSVRRKIFRNRNITEVDRTCCRRMQKEKDRLSSPRLCR